MASVAHREKIEHIEKGRWHSHLGAHKSVQWREGRPIGIKRQNQGKNGLGSGILIRYLSDPCFRLDDDLSEGVAMEKRGTGLATVNCG